MQLFMVAFRFKIMLYHPMQYSDPLNARLVALLFNDACNKIYSPLVSVVTRFPFCVEKIFCLVTFKRTKYNHFLKSRKRNAIRVLIKYPTCVPTLPALFLLFFLLLCYPPPPTHTPTLTTATATSFMDNSGRVPYCPSRFRLPSRYTPSPTHASSIHLPSHCSSIKRRIHREAVIL